MDVSSDKAARFVCLSIPGSDVIFSDNYFDLPAARSVRVRVESGLPEDDLSSVTAISLRDSY